jgi:hypothetical protein
MRLNLDDAQINDTLVVGIRAHLTALGAEEIASFALDLPETTTTPRFLVATQRGLVFVRVAEVESRGFKIDTQLQPWRGVAAKLSAQSDDSLGSLGAVRIVLTLVEPDIGALEEDASNANDLRAFATTVMEEVDRAWARP